MTTLTTDLPGEVVDVDLALDVTHASSDQLDVFLVSPLGTTVTLTTDNGGGNDDVFAGAVFDDQASGAPSAPNVRNVTYANLVPVGPIQPEAALGALDGEPAAGPWALVIVDDSGGTSGMLRGWSLTLTTLAAVPPAAPVATFSGQGANIPDNDSNGVDSTIAVSGLGPRILDVDVAVSITHDNASQIDLFLTSPSGRRIDLVTDVGGGNVDLYQGTTFDDDALVPVSDAMLPSSGTPFDRVVPEGALGAFTGEDPNGTWALTVADDSGGTTGKLDGWQLHVTTVAPCGDAVVGPGEACDDGNGFDGDGCDHDCSISRCGNGIVGVDETCDDGNTVDGDGCSSACQIGETACDNCADDDGNGRADFADTACTGGAVLELARGNATAKGTLNLRGRVALGNDASGPVGVVVGDGNGPVLCTSLGDAIRKGSKRMASAKVAGGTLSVLIRGGRVVVKGRRLDLSALDDPNLNVGVAIGGYRFAGGGVFRKRGSKRLYP